MLQYQKNMKLTHLWTIMILEIISQYKIIRSAVIDCLDKNYIGDKMIIIRHWKKGENR